MHKMFVFVNSKVIFKTAVRLSPSFIIPIFGSHNEYDYDYVNKPEDNTKKTGFDRVKKMFTKNEHDEISHELNNVLQMSLCGVFFGACMGGFVKSRYAYVNFIENNQATIFKSTMEAKKKLQDQVTVAFARGAYHWGWRLGIFTGLLVYRDDSSLVEYVSAGAITGALYKANLGPAAMLVGAGLGILILLYFSCVAYENAFYGAFTKQLWRLMVVSCAALSVIGGICVLSILKITGRSMDDIRASLYKIRQAREEQFSEVMEKAATEKHDNLTMHHDLLVHEKGAQKIDELS